MEVLEALELMRLRAATDSVGGALLRRDGKGVARVSRPHLGAVASCLIAVALAGCGTTVIDGPKVERLIRRQATGGPRLKVRSVKCPTDQPAKKGAVFICTMVLTNGEAVPFKVTQTNGSGRVDIEPAQMIATYVENAVRQRLAAQGVRATAACPRHVPVVVGNKFSCSITAASGQRAVVEITIDNTGGSFTPGTVRPG